LGGLIAAAYPAAACSPYGTGNVDIGAPAEVRAKVEGSPTTAKGLSGSKAKALEIEEAAAKKHPKLN
jgi:hypothetical protein